MRVVKISFLVVMILVTSFLVTGCWNYREVDDMAIVAGVAIDKGKKENFRLTVEVIQVSGGSNSATTSKVITMEGKSIFDAARNGISITGKKLYWSHTKVLIISKEIAEKGVASIMDWYNRDSETRYDVKILVSKGSSAAEILTGKKTTDQIKSFELNDMLKNQKNLSKAPQSNMVIFFNALEGVGICPVLPAIELKKMNGSKVPVIMGAGVFKGDKLIGYLNGDETKNFLFIRDEVKGGLLLDNVKVKDKSQVTLEVFKSKTKVNPIINGKDIKISIKIDVDTAIDEIDGETNVIDEKGRQKLESIAAETLKKQVEDVIKKMQHKYKTDVLGFGLKINQEDPKVWKRIQKDDWKKKYQNLEVNVDAKVHIRNSAELSKPLNLRK